MRLAMTDSIIRLVCMIQKRLPAVFFLLILLLQGCNTTSTTNNTTFAPIEYDKAFKLGQRVKFADSGAYMARTSGTSMDPVLTKNTIIIVRPIDFDDLEIGMTVGYLTAMETRCSTSCCVPPDRMPGSPRGLTIPARIKNGSLAKISWVCFIQCCITRLQSREPVSGIHV